MKTSPPLKITDAIHSIKDQHCQMCGSPAKGFIFRKTLPNYYCRKCLRQEFSASNSVAFASWAR